MDRRRLERHTRSQAHASSAVHFNGGVNLRDVETVMRGIVERVPAGLHRIPDGEIGDRQQWIFFQLQKFWQTPGLEEAGTADFAEGYEQMPKVRLAEGTDPDDVAWPNLGYADAYRESFEIFSRLREQELIPDGVRFQVEYPTPLASINAWVAEENQAGLERSYERALSPISTVSSSPCRTTSSPSNGTSPSSSASSRWASARASRTR